MRIASKAVGSSARVNDAFWKTFVAKSGILLSFFLDLSSSGSKFYNSCVKVDDVDVVLNDASDPLFPLIRALYAAVSFLFSIINKTASMLTSKKMMTQKRRYVSFA